MSTHTPRLIIGVIAAITITSATALALGADPRTVAGTPMAEPLTADDREFIEATDQIFPGAGYSDVAARTRINVASQACARMDADPGVVVNDFLVAALGPREHAGYLAAWFEQITIEHYCPQHSDRIGII